jgi:peroxiredoxin
MRYPVFAAALTCTIVMSACLSTVQAEAIAGKPAPAFSAIDSNGQTVELAAYKGKTVVLEWTNHNCPYVRKHYGAGNMQALQSAAAAQGVVWLTVVSSAPGMQGFVSGLEANALTDERKAKPTAVLLDPKGSIGKAYGATSTPHMYVIGPDGTLAYGGAIDDKPTSNPADIAKARNYVTEAIQAVAAGKPMSPAQTRSYGCSVKYQGS